uniref:Molybdopterin molybdenumtransferase n=1 Tax=Candidatus Kentrum sp. TUN TaxID=2126343 RepID=A0A450ZBJ2_9GAMM|nr:MAG: molybdopterin molybdochelatase [Candidatus Kentron sp. TUN]VFK51361.1 MAG: molybdopterin molybdochelatase [Candidatus Kentron sp. TUN]VFK54487.1 MAG: molybdopterin molybdochelatase [Candidatus Kentron sp. TUN]
MVNAIKPEYAATQLSVSEARMRIVQKLGFIAETELVDIRGALGRILSQDILAPLDVPPHTNSAMDGYAVRSVDLLSENLHEFTVIGTAWAGKPYKDSSIQAGETVQIMTGAVIPIGADTVLMQEHVQRKGNTIRIPAHMPKSVKGQHIRAAGEDLPKNTLVLRAGKRILPADLGLLASLGIGEIEVRRRLRVAFFCTGDELRSIGEPLEEGNIYDSNRYTLYGMLTRLGVQINDLGIVADQHAAIRETIEQASVTSDVVIGTGGVSVGEADHVKAVLQELGQVHFWKVAMKPGHPLAFGRVGPARFFGLPGNPVAVMVNFYQFVQPSLVRMAGEIDPPSEPNRQVPCISRLSKKIGRTEFMRGVLEVGPDGPTVRKTGVQGSGILHSMSVANCFIVLSPEQGTIEPGTLVEVQPFSGLV